MVLKLEAPLSPPNEGHLIGQSIQVPDNVPDDTSALEMSWHDSGFTSSMTPDISGGIPRSISAYTNTLKAQRQAPNQKQSSQLDTSHRSDVGSRPVRRSSLSMSLEQREDETELSKVAEAAAYDAFEAAAAQRDGMVRRKSTLVSNDSSIDVSWFAKNGLMSRRSFEKYKKEMKQSRRRKTMIDEDERPLFPSRSARKNEEFDISKLDDLTPPFASDAGRVILNKQKKEKKKEPLSRPILVSRSLDGGLDDMVRGFISALSKQDQVEDKEKQMSRLNAKLSESITNGDATVMSKEEIDQLTKLMIKIVKQPSKSKKFRKKQEEPTKKNPKKHEDEAALIQTVSFRDDDASISLNDMITEHKKQLVMASTSSETLKLGNKLQKAGFVSKFKYAPKRLNSKEQQHDFNTSETSNMALSKTSEIAVTSEVQDQDQKEFGLDTPISMKKSFIPRPPFVDHNESMTSIQPVTSVRTASGPTQMILEDLHPEEVKKEHAATKRCESIISETRPLTPPRRASFRETNVIPMRRSSDSLQLDYGYLEGPMPKQDCGDILAEGMEYLSMTMLVNIYGKLRELSILGHASIKLIDVDVNSHQRNSRLKEMRRRGMFAQLEQEESKGYLDTTKTAEFVVRAVLDEYEILESSSDLSPLYAVSKASMQYDASLLSEFKTWVEESKVKQMDSVTETIIVKLREESTKREAMIAERASYGSLSSLENTRISKALARRRNSLETKDNSFEKASWPLKEKTLIEYHFGLHKEGAEKGSITSSLINKKLQESSSDYFEEGSVMKNLLEAGTEVVWFSDRHPNDLIYGICVNRRKKTVTIVFRGQESIFNMIINSGTTEYPNPISHEDYPGNADTIKLRSAIADEMLRIRRDTRMSAVEEIIAKVEKIGYELDESGKYHVSVAGHGMAGSMATVLGYFLATNSSFKSTSAVRVFSFASSRIGCKAFQRSFEHLEKSGRILHARFTNSHDLSFFPSFSLDNNWKINCWYQDVGMHIRLHKSTHAGRKRTKQSLDVTYSTSNKADGVLTQCIVLFMSLLSSFVALSRGGWGKNSRISVYQSRMHFAREYRLALGGAASAHRFDMKRKNLKSLNDYYIMKCRCAENYAAFKKQKDGMPWFLLSFMVLYLVCLELAILVKFVAKW